MIRYGMGNNLLQSGTNKEKEVALTLHVNELPGLFVVGWVNLVVEVHEGHIGDFGRRDDESSAYCPLQVVLLLRGTSCLQVPQVLFSVPSEIGSDS